jgi:hypothetical protein
MKVLSNIMSINTARTELNLRYNNIGPKGAASIAHSLLTNVTLTKLNKW